MVLYLITATAQDPISQKCDVSYGSEICIALSNKLETSLVAHNEMWRIAVLAVLRNILERTKQMQKVTWYRTPVFWFF
jgi:hypothetical protein